jgi:hypothetical protein
VTPINPATLRAVLAEPDLIAAARAQRAALLMVRDVMGRQVWCAGFVPPPDGGQQLVLRLISDMGN